MASDKDTASGGDDANGHPDAATALNTNQAVLQYFWDMASYDENVRVAAARGLVLDVVKDQKKHQATLGQDNETPPEESAPKVKQLEYHLRRCSPTMTYTLRRLARGLGSSRQAARQGYAAALTGLLAASSPASAGGARFISAAGVLVLLEVCIDGPLRGGDAKDTLLGRVFGFGALLRSGLPLEPAVLVALLTGLLDCGHRKSFLRECSAAVAVEAAGRIDAATLAGMTAPGQPLATALAVAPAEATPEALLLALVLWPKLPASVVSTCRLLPPDTPPPPPELWASGSAPLSSEVAAAAARTAAGLFSREHIRTLLHALLGSSSSHPRLHTVWLYLLPLLLPGFRPQQQRNNNNETANGVVAAAADSAAEAEAAPAAPAPGGKKAAKAAAKAAKAAAAAARSAEGKGAVAGPLLEAFWGVVVEGGLMESSTERRFLGFQLFSRVLPHLRPDTVGIVFSPTFVKHLAGGLKLKNNHLHASAKKLMDGLTAFVDRSSSADVATKMAVVAAMSAKNLSSHGLLNKVVQSMDSEGLHRHLVSLMDAFLRGKPPLRAGQQLDEEVEGADGEQVMCARRSQCVDQLVGAIKRFPATSEADGGAALRFLALHAFAHLEPQAPTPAGKAPKASAKKQPKQQQPPEVAQAAELLTTPLSPATRTACASRLLALISHLAATAQARLHNSAKQQRGKAGSAEGDAAAAADQPSAKKRKTAAGTAAAGAAEATQPPPPAVPAAAAGSVHSALHDTLSYIRKVLALPGVGPAAELGAAGESGFSLLAAIETAALERVKELEGKDAAAAVTATKTVTANHTPGGKGPKAVGAAKADQQQHGGSGGGAAASRARALAALAGQLQLALLSDPAGFEMDLPLSLRRVAAEGLGLEGLPEVEEVEEESGDSGKEGKSDEGESDGEMATEGVKGGKKAQSGCSSGPSGPSGAWSDVLVDLMLALMARPAGSVPIAPLREAAEAVWRQCCEGVTAEGLADLVRVVAAGGKGEGQDDSGLFEDEEEEEEEEGSESEEEEDGSGSEEEEDESVQRKKQKKGGSKRKNAGEGDSSSSSEGGSDDEEGGKGGSDDEDEEGMDDETMFRMDSKLAAYFRSMVDGKAGGKAAAERAAALLDFRLRALRLLEVLHKKNTHNSLLLTALVPLVRTLATAARPGGQPQMALRLKALITGMSRGRYQADLSVLGGSEGFSTSLKRLLYEASRNKDKAVAGVAWEAFTGAVKAGAAAAKEQPEAIEAARSGFRAALTDWLTKKKTRLLSKQVARAFRTAPSAALPALDLLLHHVAAGRSAAVRAKAAELTGGLFTAPPLGMAQVWAAGGGGAAALGGALGTALAACAAGVGLKARLHNKAALAAVSVCRVLTKRFLGGRRPAELMGSDKVNAIAKAVVTVKSIGVAPKVSAKLDQLSEVLGLGPLLEKTKPDPALAAKIQKASPATAADGQGKQQKDKNKDGGKEGKKEDKVQKQKGKEKKKEEGKAKRKKLEEEEEEEEEAGGGSSGSEEEEADDDKASGSGSEGDSDEEEGDEEEPSGSGRGDSDDDDEDGEEGGSEAGSSDDDEEEGRGKGGPKRGGGAGSRGGRGQGRGGGGGRGRGGRRPGRGGEGGRGRGAGGRGRGGKQQGQGGNPAKRARH